MTFTIMVYNAIESPALLVGIVCHDRAMGFLDWTGITITSDSPVTTDATGCRKPAFGILWTIGIGLIFHADVFKLCHSDSPYLSIDFRVLI